jgi:hypothetical protein
MTRWIMIVAALAVGMPAAQVARPNETHWPRVARFAKTSEALLGQDAPWTHRSRRATLEKAGVEFINVDQPGVRLRKPG